MSDRRISVLLIEDNPGDVRMIRELLSEAKGVTFAVECADRLSTGLERLEKGEIDVVLLDLGLPDSQGLDTFTQARDRAPDFPIVVLTGLDDEATGTAAVRAGAQDYLIKGEVDGKSLARALRYAIERERMSSRIYRGFLAYTHERTSGGEQ